MNQRASQKKNVFNSNKSRSPMKETMHDLQFRSSAELARRFQIKRENLANEEKEKVMRNQTQIAPKRQNPMPTTTNTREIQNGHTSTQAEKNKLPMHKSVTHFSSREDLTTSHMIRKTSVARIHGGEEHRIDGAFKYQSQPTNKMKNPMPAMPNTKGHRLTQSEKNVTPMIGRTQHIAEKQVDIQELENHNNLKRTPILPAMCLNDFLKKQGIHVGGEEQDPVDEVRSTSYPRVDRNNIELKDVVHEEFDEDECNRDGTMDIDCDKGTSEKKKIRGRTTCMMIHARNFDEREEVTFDKGQAVRPTNKSVSDLSHFLGTIARNPRFITLTYITWHAIPNDTKQRMWEYVNSKFIIPQEGKKWVMDGLRDAWKRHKSTIKKKHFDGYDTIQDMLKNCPADIPKSHFRQLIEYWNLLAVKAMCHLNSQNRKKQKWRHRMGPINFARVRTTLRANKENNEEPSKAEMFIATRTWKGKQAHPDTQIAISELEKRQKDGESVEEAFKAVIGKEQHGRVRCYGRSVTASSLKKDEEINKLKQKHADEVTAMMKEVHELKHMFNVLVQNNPGLNLQNVVPCAGSNVPSPIDENNERVEKENLGDAFENGGRDSI